MSKEQFSEEETLSLINEMISVAKNNLQRGSGNVFLLWGCLVSITALLSFILNQIFSSQMPSNYIWLLMPIGLIVNYFIERKQRKEAKVKTYIDTFLSATWGAFFISAAILVAIFFVLNIRYPSLEHWGIIFTPITLLLAGICFFSSGVALKFRPLWLGGIFVWVMSIPCFFINYPYSHLILSVALFVGAAVPGYLLNKKARKNV